MSGLYPGPLTAADSDSTAGLLQQQQTQAQQMQAQAVTDHLYSDPYPAPESAMYLALSRLGRAEQPIDWRTVGW